MREIADNVWVLNFPLALLGTQIGRTVTVIRLRSGELVIHSTAPFRAEDVTAIRALGSPTWLVDVTLFHDTFANAGRAAFPDLSYLAPKGFPAVGGAAPASLETPPPNWASELEVHRIEGMPRVREHVFFHRPTRTLIVADLVFNFGPESTAWTRAFFRHAAGVRQFPGVSRIFRAFMRDRSAFVNSVRQILRWDFDRLIVAHGDIIDSGAKPLLAAALSTHGLV